MASNLSFAKIINKAKLMVSGIRLYPERLAKRGLDKEYTAIFEMESEKLDRIDSEQQEMKSGLKLKTAEKRAQTKVVNKMQRFNNKIVKAEMEQETWISFGITAKK